MKIDLDTAPEVAPIGVEECREYGDDPPDLFYHFICVNCGQRCSSFDLVVHCDGPNGCGQVMIRKG
jgi:hypothetical protein